MQKFYIDSAGEYLGSWDGSPPPDGSIEIQAPPIDGRMVWDGTNWNVPAPLADKIIDEKREVAYDQAGSTIEAMIVALWEKTMEGKSEAADALQVVREQVKTDIPK